MCAGEAVSNGAVYLGPTNGSDICNEPADRNGGRSVPLYNYAGMLGSGLGHVLLAIPRDLHILTLSPCADSGDDWKGLCTDGSQQSPIDYPTEGAFSTPSLSCLPCARTQA